MFFLEAIHEKYYKISSLIKNNFIVVSGGPGGGKTTVLKALLHKGFNYVQESGRAIIQERKIKGQAPRPDPALFARQMFHIDLESFMNNLEKEETIFFDRSFLDSAFLIRQTDPAYFERILPVLNSHRFNKKVFVTPPWQEIYTNDSERDQTFNESIHIYENLCDWYLLHAYEPVILPRLSVEMRAGFILKEIAC